MLNEELSVVADGIATEPLLLPIVGDGGGEPLLIIFHRDNALTEEERAFLWLGDGADGAVAIFY